MIEQDGVVLDEWFMVNGRWHAFKAAGASGTEGWCGLMAVETSGAPVQATITDPYPPSPCRRCLQATAMRDAEDEPLDLARSRGYLPPED